MKTEFSAPSEVINSAAIANSLKYSTREEENIDGSPEKSPIVCRLKAESFNNRGSFISKVGEKSISSEK